ncbi:MAG: NAD(P)H-dependent oxidoreductase [Bacteroidales bacterium]|nr:NAD(P)H-dependent oxidoreductase [Bacteroidales bacterium]
MKKILIINGHPFKGSFSYALAEAYRKGAEQSGASVEMINLGELEFNPNLQFGYSKRMQHEPDLVNAWERIKAADHLVWVFPLWWNGFPAVMKGFIDRLFLPGMAFAYRENSIFWDKLLTNKTSRIITTMDQPVWYYKLMIRQPATWQLRKGILAYCGIRTLGISYFGSVRSSEAGQRDKWLQSVMVLGRKMR